MWVPEHKKEYTKDLINILFSIIVFETKYRKQEAYLHMKNMQYCFPFIPIHSEFLFE